MQDVAFLQDVACLICTRPRKNQQDVSAHVCEVSTMNNYIALSLKTIIHDKKASKYYVWIKNSAVK